mgnify:CR=1 FL=1
MTSSTVDSKEPSLLITVISASINGLFGNFLRQAITDHDIHMYTVLRFTVGDIIGCITCLLYTSDAADE